jgi:hypothetical protein
MMECIGVGSIAITTQIGDPDVISEVILSYVESDGGFKRNARGSFKSGHAASAVLRSEVTLRVTVGQSVCLGVEPALGLATRY